MNLQNILVLFINRKDVKFPKLLENEVTSEKL